jgi:thiol-disulfide isomerase/thioredoxin
MTALRPAVPIGLLALLMATAGVVSCDGEGNAQTPPRGRSSEVAPPASAEAAPARGQEDGGSITDVTAAGLNEVRAAIADHDGKVVLVDFWATWCPPCVEAFPKVLSWHDELGPEGLAIVLVSVDDPSDPGAVREFLRTRSSSLGSLLLDVPEYDAFVRGFGADWGGEVPALFVYSRNGELQHSFTTGEEAETVLAAIEEQLAISDRP